MSTARVHRGDEAGPLTDEAELLALEALYCSHGDTVHYTDPPKIFETLRRLLPVRREGPPVPRSADVVLGGEFRLRQPAPQRRGRSASSTACRSWRASTSTARRSSWRRTSRRDAARKFGAKGRVHFNVGGSQAVEDSLKLVRNFKKGKSLMFAFEGGYHGRTLGASAITSSYRYRRRYGHFGDRAQFVPFPYHFRGPKGMSKEEYGHHCVQAVRAAVRERVQRRVGPEGGRGRIRRLLRRADPGHGRLRHSAARTISSS